MTRVRYYTAYGLRIRSEVRLPQFGREQPGETDVIVRYGAVPQHLHNPKLSNRHWDVATGDYLLRVNNDLRIRVSTGREITVWSAERTRSLAAVYIAGTAFTALLQQRDLLTLHASAVRTKHGAVLFCGRSGAGKSTHAAAMAAWGFNILADDVTPIRITSQGLLLAIPGYPTLRLLADAFSRLGLSAENLQLAKEGGDKYLLPVKGFISKPITVHSAYVFNPKTSQHLEFIRAKPSNVFQILRRHTHRRHLVKVLMNPETHFSTLVEFSKNVPVIQVRQPDERMAPDGLAECIANHFQEHI